MGINTKFQKKWKKGKARHDKRSGQFNRHHIQAKKRGGDKSIENLLRMDSNRHSAFHLLFGNKNFKEVAELLLRVYETKRKA